MDKNYYIQKYEDRMMEIYNMFTDEEYCTRWFDETANAEEVVGYYFVHYEWNPLKGWLENLEFVKDVTEQDKEVTRILMELCGSYRKVDTMSLQDVIESNIEWFWNNDPIIWFNEETGCYREEPLVCDGETVDKFWVAFRDWCIEDCKECFDGHGEVFIEPSIIEEAVFNNFDNWLNWNK